MPQTTPIRIMIADDHAMVRSGLRLFLSSEDDLEVVAEAGDGQEAIDLCPDARPDVILMDIVMPVLDGPAATAQIRRDFPQIQVIALTSYLQENLVQSALRAGAISYLLKDVGADKLVEAIHSAHRGRSTLDAGAARMLVQAADQPPPLGHDLTSREREVLALVAQGMQNKEIARLLALSPGTVRIYVSEILSKLGARNRTEATALALQHGLVDIGAS
jgi:NarL family two-component system response regulator LiaR